MKSTAQVTESIDTALAEKIAQVREHNRLPIKRIMLLWMPCLFTLFIAAIVLTPTFLKIGVSLPSGMIVLVCFLPMAFFFSAQATFNEISALEARIRELEKK